MDRREQLNLADECLSAAGDDWDAAAAKLVRKARSDAKLIASALESWAYDLVREASRKARDASVKGVVTTPGPGATSSAAALKRMGAQRAASILDMPLPGGKRLGSANHSEVMAAAQLYGRNRRGNAVQEAFLLAVCKRLPKNDSKVVEDVASAKSVQAIRDAAKGDTK